MKPWIGVDLDGTLAEYTGWMGPEHIGAPISLMAERVKRWVAEGRDVRIFTARVSHDGTPERVLDAERARVAIERWCRHRLLLDLRITNVKDYAMVELW